MTRIINFFDETLFFELEVHTYIRSSFHFTTTNNMALNYNKTKQMRICFTKDTPDILSVTINDIQIEQVHSTRLLGVTISQYHTWRLHIDDITTKLHNDYASSF